MIILNFFFSAYPKQEEAPPGTIRVNNLYVDQAEILNIAYLEFLYYMKPYLDTTEYNKLLPVGLHDWSRLPANRFKPAVGITYDQALAYCTWRSKFVSYRLGKEIIYRLPTKEEWSGIAKAVLLTERKKIERELEKTRKVIAKENKDWLILECKDCKENSRTQNRKKLIGVYNLFDSVSEMTPEEGIAMGTNNGDLVDTKETLHRVVKYDSANPYLGFRCVAEIK